MKQVSVILVNYNTKELTSKAIQSVFDKTKNTDFEVIVVDNDSCDGSIEYFNSLFKNKITLIKSNKNLGFGTANNLAIQQATGKYIFLLNSDTQLLNDAINIFYNYMESNINVGVCGGNLFNTNNEPATSYCMYKKSIYKFIYWQFLQSVSKILSPITNKKFYFNFNYSSKPKEVGYISGADMFIRKSVLEQSGIFDETIFMYSEDIDLNFRIKDCDFSIISLPQARIMHIDNASFNTTTSENILKNYRIRKDSEYKFYFKIFNKYTYIIYIQTQIINIFKIILNTILPNYLLKKIYLIVKPTSVYKSMFNIDKEEFSKAKNRR